MDIYTGSISNRTNNLLLESINTSSSSSIKINSSTDYNGLALILTTAESLKQATREFLYTFDPKRFYMHVQGMNSAPQHKINTLV